MSQRFWQRAKLESPVFNQVYQVDQSFASARHPQRVINRYVLVTFITFTANDDVALRAFHSSLFNSIPSIVRARISSSNFSSFRLKRKLISNIRISLDSKFFLLLFRIIITTYIDIILDEIIGISSLKKNV